MEKEISPPDLGSLISYVRTVERQPLPAAQKQVPVPPGELQPIDLCPKDLCELSYSYLLISAQSVERRLATTYYAENIRQKPQTLSQNELEMLGAYAKSEEKAAARRAAKSEIPVELRPTSHITEQAPAGSLPKAAAQQEKGKSAPQFLERLKGFAGGASRKAAPKPKEKAETMGAKPEPQTASAKPELQPAAAKPPTPQAISFQKPAPIPELQPAAAKPRTPQAIPYPKPSPSMEPAPMPKAQAPARKMETPPKPAASAPAQAGSGARSFMLTTQSPYYGEGRPTAALPISESYGTQTPAKKPQAKIQKPMPAQEEQGEKSQWQAERIEPSAFGSFSGAAEKMAAHRNEKTIAPETLPWQTKRPAPAAQEPPPAKEKTIAPETGKPQPVSRRASSAAPPPMESVPAPEPQPQAKKDEGFYWADHEVPVTKGMFKVPESISQPKAAAQEPQIAKASQPKIASPAKEEQANFGSDKKTIAPETAGPLGGTGDQSVEAYARQNLPWLLELYNMKGISLDDLRSQVGAHMGKGGQAKQQSELDMPTQGPSQSAFTELEESMKKFRKK